MSVRPFIILSLAVSFLLTAGHASAQNLKIGVVDMKRLFQEYYKTKEADKKLSEDKSKAKKELDERMNKYRELITKWQETEKILKDSLLNEELKMQKQKEGQDLLSEARALERDIDEFRRRREQQLAVQMNQMRKGLLDEIQARVEEKSKRDNYDLMIDKSGMSPSGVPFLLYTKDLGDITNEVLSELNKNAPKESASAPAPAPAAGGKKK